MPAVTIAHHPHLTYDRTLDIFKERLGNRYHVDIASLLGVQRIVVNKTDWVGATIELRQKLGGTSFVFRGYIPSKLYRWLLGGLITTLILRSKWRHFEEEITAFIESAPEFK